MRQVEKHVIKEGHEWFDYCTDITTIFRQLYNTAQFTQRQGFFYGWGTQTQASLDALFKQNENYKAMKRESSPTCFKAECRRLDCLLQSIISLRNVHEFIHR
ncbi:hypothetical protein [Nostoc sp. LPT]|uniref:hypothetical protein n=1 Tax=Nostoc sp. LPT TaxID=2815387 RepID=UPI0025CE2269|nr:hypothetical protein [Nostoc sp. LPT]